MKRLHASIGIALVLVALTASIALAAHQIISTVVYDGGTTVATYQVIDDPAEERGGAGPVMWKQFCPRWYELRQIPEPGGGVHVLCVRMAEVRTDNNR